jgi:hypothetical protein
MMMDPRQKEFACVTDEADGLTGVCIMTPRAVSHILIVISRLMILRQWHLLIYYAFQSATTTRFSTTLMAAATGRCKFITEW